jgi:hypothetical protein
MFFDDDELLHEVEALIRADEEQAQMMNDVRLAARAAMERSFCTAYRCAVVDEITWRRHGTDHPYFQMAVARVSAWTFVLQQIKRAHEGSAI